jgi:FtsH-binding integral membrane protein
MDHNQYYNNYGVFENNNNNKQNNYMAEDMEFGVQKMNTELNMRLGFIRKVYGILSVQLLITTFLCIVSMTSHSFAKFQMRNTWAIWLCAIGGIIVVLAISCFRELARKVPTNYILLFLFTAFESYLVSAMCAITNPRLVLMAAAMTCGITIALTLYACTTKSDFTICGSLLFVLGCILFLFSLFAIFTHNKIFHIILSCFGVLLFSFYLIYDTQLLLGSKENSLEMDEYIFAALMLYLDIINLFLYILKLLKETE